MALAAERSFVMAVKEAKDIIAGLGRSVDLVYLVCQWDVGWSPLGLHPGMGGKALASQGTYTEISHGYRIPQLAQIPKDKLVKGPYKPICSVLFN